MVHFAVCFDMNHGHHSIHIGITDYLMEPSKNFETNQIFRSLKTKKSTTISHGVYFFYVKTNNVGVKRGWTKNCPRSILLSTTEMTSNCSKLCSETTLLVPR